MTKSNDKHVSSCVLDQGELLSEDRDGSVKGSHLSSPLSASGLSLLQLSVYPSELSLTTPLRTVTSLVLQCCSQVY